VPYTHRWQRTPVEMRRAICTKVDSRHGCPPSRMGLEEELWKHPRGVAQRNTGLEVVRKMKPVRTSVGIYPSTRPSHTHAYCFVSFCTAFSISWLTGGAEKTAAWSPVPPEHAATFSFAAPGH